MLKFTAKTNTETTINDIPKGQIFEGTIVSRTMGEVTGVWLRLFNAGQRAINGDYWQQEGETAMAVCLTQLSHNGNPIVFWRCAPVTGYRPLKNPRIVEDA